jgi:hypothetical protein
MKSTREVNTSQFNQPESYVAVTALIPEFCVSPLNEKRQQSLSFV